MKPISFIIPVFNNFEYTKHLYENICSYFPEDEIVISDGGSTDETINYFTGLKNDNLVFLNNGSLNLCENYNIGVSNSTKDIVVLLHNDMFIPPNFKQKLLDEINEYNIISYARIEPSVFPGEEPGKVVRDFGYGLEDLQVDNIIKFSETYNLKYKGGGYLFIACYKDNWIKLDEISFNPPQMWAADDDLHLRYRNLGLDLIISDAIVYHFVSKTSRKDDSYKQVEIHSNRNFIRKWGFRTSKYNIKYDIAYVVKNCNYNALFSLEPFCSRIYIDDEMEVLRSHYLDKEQQNTSFDLTKKIYITKFNDPLLENDIIVDFDISLASPNSFNILQQLPDIIKETNEIGVFELDIFRITINSIKEYQNELINILK